MEGSFAVFKPCHATTFQLKIGSPEITFYANGLPFNVMDLD